MSRAHLADGPRRIVSNWLFMNKPNITHVHQVLTTVCLFFGRGRGRLCVCVWPAGEVLVSPTFLYVIMEYLDGPDLSDWMLADEAVMPGNSQEA